MVRRYACGEKGLRQRSQWPGLWKGLREVVAKSYACGEKGLWQLWPGVTPAERVKAEVDVAIRYAGREKGLR